MTTTFEPINNIAPWGCNTMGAEALREICNTGDISGVGEGPFISAARAAHFAGRIDAYLFLDDPNISPETVEYLEKTAAFFRACGGFTQS